MGFFSIIFGFLGFGVGISAGLVMGYYLFVYFQPCDVKVCVNFPFFGLTQALRLYTVIFLFVLFNVNWYICDLFGFDAVVRLMLVPTLDCLKFLLPML